MADECLISSRVGLGTLSLANIGYTAVRSLAHRIRPDDWEPGLEMAARLAGTELHEQSLPQCDPTGSA